MLDKGREELFKMKGIQLINPYLNAEDTVIKGKSSNAVLVHRFLPFDGISTIGYGPEPLPG